MKIIQFKNDIVGNYQGSTKTIIINVSYQTQNVLIL